MRWAMLIVVLVAGGSKAESSQSDRKPPGEATHAGRKFGTPAINPYARAPRPDLPSVQPDGK